MNILKLLFVYFLLQISLFASATKYYISNSSGDDSSGDGLSEASAWQTISKVNGLGLLPGDSVLFKKGDVWREFLIVQYSGTPDSYITFSSYGSGDNPKILGSKEAIVWENQGSNVWKTTATFIINPRGSGNTSDIFFEGSDGSVSWGVYKSTIGELAEEYDWTWSSDYVYVYAASDPAARYGAVEVPQRRSAINLNDKQYLSFSGIDLHYLMRSGYTYSSYPIKDLSGVMIKGSHIAYIGSSDAEVGFGTEVVYSDMVIRNNTIHDCGRRSIALNLYGNDYTAENILIEGNKLFNGSHTTGIDMNVGASGTTGSINNVTIRYNEIYDDPTSSHFSNLIFIQNYHKGGLLTNVYIYSNIFKYPTFSGIQLEDVEKIYIYNNTFYGHSTGRTSNTFHIYMSNNSHNIKIKNNIFYTLLDNDSNGSGVCIVTNNTDPSGVDADYNIYYRINNSIRIISSEGEKYYMNDSTSIRSMLGWENHGQFVDPEFVSSSDLNLQEGSPAIGAGINVGVVTAFDGNAFRNPPSIGAYEGNTEDPPPPPPPGQVSISIRPNPSSGEINIIREGSTIEAQEIKIYTLSGRLVFSDTLDAGVGEESFTLTLNQGVYIIQILSSEEDIITAQKFIIIE